MQKGKMKESSLKSKERREEQRDVRPVISEEGRRERGMDGGDNRESSQICGCVSESHSTRVECRDSTWLTKPTELKGQSCVDISRKEFTSVSTVASFHFLLT